MIALGKPLGCCVHRCDELNTSPCLPLHLTHRHAPFSQCGWFHLLACLDVMTKSLSYPSRQGFPRQIGRASCRERVCQYVSISVFAATLKKKNNTNIYRAPTKNQQNIEYI